MNNKDWDENDFYDDEGDDGDEDEYNDMGSDIDANNDETFDNAAEWNEDEHEELIARDSILSHTNRINDNNHSSSNNHHHHHPGNNVRITNNNSNNHNLNDILNSRHNNNINNGTTDLDHNAMVANLLGAASSSNWESSTERNNLFPALSRQNQGPTGQPSQIQQPSSSNIEAPWHTAVNPSERLQRLQMQQQQLLLQTRLQDQDQLRQQQMRDRHVLQQQRELQFHAQQQNVHQAPSMARMEVGRQILRVDELESQLRRTTIDAPTAQSNTSPLPELSRRAGWSPFGGKDLFTNPDPSVAAALAEKFGLYPPLEKLNLEEAQRRMLLQQEMLQQHVLELKRFELFKQQQLEQQQQQQQQLINQQKNQMDPRIMPPNTKCFTVEELERQMLASSRSADQKAEVEKKEAPPGIHYALMATLVPPETTKTRDKDRQPTVIERRNGEKHDRHFEKHHHRDISNAREFRDTRRDNRANRENRFHHNKKEPAIIPPQVQLSVIEKARRLHSISTMHPDEFLQDKVPTTSNGFRFKKHSDMASEKVNHDGILTEKERSWLTRIQEKIQADYDDNIDQDYYYLLYFNRTSMGDEVAQKPGPSVSDRRFIPRERLLYTSGV